MCGIAGILSGAPAGPELERVVERMARALKARGPDDHGVWVDRAAGVALGHRRLAILDLSEEGRQPKLSSCGRYAVTFNGEIYNFRLLRRELEALGHVFRGQSDTEVLLAAVVEWGVREALARLNGMFAFAIWDRTERVLSLARDRLGEKPLYYAWTPGGFVFGSELKALRESPSCGREVDRGALALYFRHGYVPAPHTIYRDVFKLPAASLLEVTASGEIVSPVAYWSVREAMERGAAHPVTCSDADAVHELDALLREAVKMRMASDVPLGAFLSGGIDSSTVVALMQAQSDAPVQTFTIGFQDLGYDEAVHARRVADHLGTDHHELYVTARQALDVIPTLPAVYDEPFADSSQIPTILVSALARRRVTVALSGDGGDELFGGYTRYVRARAIWRALGALPSDVRRPAARLIGAIPLPRLEELLGRLAPGLHRRCGAATLAYRVVRLVDALAVSDPSALYRSLVSHWSDADALVLHARRPATLLDEERGWASLGDFTPRMMYLDAVTYLPDDILVKMDRASMSVSLEARVPLLDHRLVELAWRLPRRLKVRNGTGKWILRKVLHRYVPRALVDRPKQGFGVPIGSWLRGPLRDWAEALLDERRLREQGLLDARLIRRRWGEHLAQQRDWQYHLWDVLVFQDWLRAS